MKNNRENAKKFLEENGLFNAGDNYKNKLIEKVVEYANNITSTSDDTIDYGLVNDVIPNVSIEVFERTFKEIIVDKLGVDEFEIIDEANLRNDLGCDSLDTIELLMALESKFSFSIPDDIFEIIGSLTFKDIIEKLYHFYTR